MIKRLILLCLPFILVSCGENNPIKKVVEAIVASKANARTEQVTERYNEVEDLIVDGVYLSQCMKIYSKSYDGFLNIRESTTTKSRQIGQFRNGPEPAYVLKREGKWLKIYYRGMKGYVHESLISYEPTIAVTVNVDADWLEGIWGNNGYTAYLIFNNGTYAYEQQYGTICVGTYMLEGNEIVLTPVVHLQSDYHAGRERLAIDVSRRTLGGMSRNGFCSEADLDGEYWDNCMITKDSFKSRKKHYKTLLPK